MDEYLEFSVQHMVNRGLRPEMIPGIMRDVANILSRSNTITRSLLNEKAGTPWLG